MKMCVNRNKGNARFVRRILKNVFKKNQVRKQYSGVPIPTTIQNNGKL